MNNETDNPIQTKGINNINYLIIIPLAITIAITVSALWESSVNLLNVAVIIFLIIVAPIILLISSDKKIYLKNDGILVKKKFRQYKIMWEEIISMATVPHRGFGLFYEIKTSKKTLCVSLPIEWRHFQDAIVENANLEVWSESMYGESLSLPGIKRWNKKGQKYVPTSISDRFTGLFYKMKI